MTSAAQQSCWYFATGKCSYGASCRYSHDATKKEDHGDAARWKPHRVCKYYQEGRCYKGEACTFSHESKGATGSSKSAQIPDAPKLKTAQAEDNPAFLTWRRDIPDMRRGPARRLGTVGLSQFFQTAWKMISLRDTATTPRVITSLASEGGLSRVDELSKVELDRLSLAGKRSCFEKLVLPFLRVITHKDVLSSFISENAVGTIYTFFYGANGRRAIPLLRSIGGILLTIKLESERNDEFIATSASATLAALDQLIICNQAACIEDGISEIVDIISACIGERNDHVELSLNLQAAYCHLDKIRMRMCFGNKIPSLTEKRAPASEGLASFDVGQEWPGLLSADGPRHDNDHENICDIKILPTAGEIRSHRPEYLPTTDPDKLHLAGVRGLLDRQFRLLREDTVGQLRDCVRLIMENLTDPTFQASSGKRALHGAHVFVYNHVSLSNLTFDKRKGLQITIEFEQSSAVKKMATEQARRTWWGETKQLQQDSLLCLVDSYGRSVFLSVSDRDGSRDIHEGHAENGSESALEVTATPRLGLSNHGIPSGWSQDGETPINPPPEDTGKTRPCNLWNNRERSSIAVQMVEISEKEILGILGRFKSHLHIKQALVEFPGVLVPSFRPTLQALQLMSRTLEVPFFDLLAPTADTKGAALNAVVDIPAPVYALQPDFEYDLSCITQDTVLKLSPHKRFDVLNLERQCTLDLAQCNALVSALTKSLALIQGPPGTGKSYVAVQLVNVLLAHREKADMGPIICVCYTNHALDQFLEHLLADGAQQVIRIGSQSKSEILKPLNLRLVAQEMEKTKLEKSEAYRYYKSLDEHVEEVVSLLSELKYADSAKTLKKYLEAHHTEQYYELYGYEEEEGWETVHSRHDNTIRDWLLNALVEPDTPNRDRNVPTLLKSRTYQMSSKERRVLYEHWVRDIMDMLAEKLAEAVDAYNSTKECLTRCNQELHLRCLKKAHVVGVTTSGLARNIELLRRLHSKVLLCEEAGEILEAHTLTALLPSIEHAILIGDHEQLRPQIQNYELSLENSRGLKYSLDVSLFERLIDRRHAGIQLPYETLATQRRMHPLISQLVRETLYPDLKDDTSVDDYPTVNGVRRRLFWLDHREGEAQKDPTQPNQVSHSNDYEVQMVAALVSHLVRQGIYQSDGIVVITPYVRQLQKIRRILSESNELHVIVGDRDQEELEKQGLDDGEISKTLSRTRKTTLLKSLKVATVDNFQGEEADVVVVSLVRSNEERRCGFLATSNRINVLLSRARHGLYIIGNAETSGHVPMWAKVISILKKANNFGPKLALCCPRHPSTSIQVSTPDDFSRLAPEGGCSLKCELRLQCGHSCSFKCHSQPRHDSVICQEPCPRRRDTCVHPCPKRCGESCDQLCRVKVHNVLLPCGHTKESVECHKAQNVTMISCRQIVKKIVPGCEHVVDTECCLNPGSNYFECQALCGDLLDCGHQCSRPCHGCKARENSVVLAADHGKCLTVCERPFSTCAHSCTAICHGSDPCLLCEQPCEVRCSHSRCGRKCQEPCAPCAEDCTWQCPHRGKCPLPCAVPCDLLPCSERCTESLTCGHQCPSVCGETCPSEKYCQICAPDHVKDLMVDYIEGLTYRELNLEETLVIVPLCGHVLSLSSMDGTMEMQDHYNISDDGSIDAIKATSPPFSAKDIKTCPMCRFPLRNLHRYNRIVKRGLIDQATKRFIVWANAGFVSLEARLHVHEERLRDANTKLSQATASGSRHTEEHAIEGMLRIQIEGPADNQIQTIRRLSGLDVRYAPILNVRRDILGFLHQVSEEEQPFSRVHQMVKNVRRQTGVQPQFEFDGSILQVRNRLLTTVLALRCDLTILSDFLNIYQTQSGARFSQHKWLRGDLLLDFSSNRKDCMSLMNDAASQHQPMHEIEARIFFARFVALERSAPTSGPDAMGQLLTQAGEGLDSAKSICAGAASTANMLPEIEDAEKLLRGSTFYTTFTNEEKRAVYAAMAQELRGTGHWYYCRYGHAFTIGECGMPMETSRCPQCGAAVGGQDHDAVEGVTRAEDIDAEFGRLMV